MYSYDDSTWFHIDTRQPHSGRHSGRIFLPEGRATHLQIPCEGTGKSDPLCKGGSINALNSTTLKIGTATVCCSACLMPGRVAEGFEQGRASIPVSVTRVGAFWALYVAFYLIVCAGWLADCCGRATCFAVVVALGMLPNMPSLELWARASPSSGTIKVYIGSMNQTGILDGEVVAQTRLDSNWQVRAYNCDVALRRHRI